MSRLLEALRQIDRCAPHAAAECEPSLGRIAAPDVAPTSDVPKGASGPLSSAAGEDAGAFGDAHPQISSKLPGSSVPPVLPGPPPVPWQPVRLSATLAEPLGSAHGSSTAEEQLAARLLARLPQDGSAVVAVISADGKEDFAAATYLRDALNGRSSERVHCVQSAEDGPPDGAIAAWRAQHRLTLVAASTSRLADYGWLVDCDGVVLVVTLGHTPCRTARRALRAIEKSRARPIGCVVRSD